MRYLAQQLTRGDGHDDVDEPALTVTSRCRVALCALAATINLAGWWRQAVGFAIVTGCGVAFTELLDAVHDHEGLILLYQPITAWTAQHRSAGLTTAMRAITTLGDAAVLVPATAAVAGLLARQARTGRPVWITALALASSETLALSVKVLAERPRPDRALAVITASGYSFPSGHATSSLAACAILAWLVSCDSGFVTSRCCRRVA